MGRLKDNSQVEWLAYNRAGKFVARKTRLMPDGQEREERYKSFAERCKQSLGKRFIMEQIDYRLHKPTIIRRIAVDLDDKFGTALAEPPTMLFSALFGLSRASAERWVTPKRLNSQMRRFLAEQNKVES